MFIQILIFVIFNIISIQNVKCNNCDMDDIYLHLFGQIDNVKKSLDIVNARLDVLSDRHLQLSRVKHESEIKYLDLKLNDTYSIFDIRYDSMPKYCSTELSRTCAEATKYTRTSGIYNITDTLYSNKTFTVYCDSESFGGDWLYILKRVDGSENFDRSWSDYIKGFGNVAGEYWIGLENLYALTNFYGPQELNVYLENFEGRNIYARYDNFVIGNSFENYTLKSLGRYWGTAGDSLYNQLGMKFSTFDKDNDRSKRNCAYERKGGFWYDDCTIVNPTGRYLRGKYAGAYEGSFWKTFGGTYYSQKSIIFMIRRRRAEKLEK